MRNVSLHTLGKELGTAICSTLIKAHILTGSDVTIKIGTKSSILKVLTEISLQGFSKDNSLSEEMLDKAERFLFQV